jgi:hypothetical protein
MGCALSQSGKDPEDRPGNNGKDAPGDPAKKEKPKKQPKEKEKKNPNGRGLGYTVTNGKKMEILHDPHVPGGKRLVPTLDAAEQSSLYIRRKSKEMVNGEPGRRSSAPTVGVVTEFSGASTVTANGAEMANGVAPSPSVVPERRPSV